MDKIEYIKIYNESLSHYTTESKKDFKIDDNLVYHNHLGTWINFKIDDCIALCDLFHEAHNYVYSLKVGQNITIRSYGDDQTATIIKINYRRLNFNPERVLKTGIIPISSLTIKTKNSEYKIEPTDIKYKNSTIYDILQIFRMFKPNGYHFFSQYDINNALVILKNKGGDNIK